MNGYLYVTKEGWRTGRRVEYQQISIREGADATMGGGEKLSKQRGEKVDALDWGGK